MANKNQQTKEKESGKMLKEKLFFCVCMLMWAICMGGLALGQNQTCPLCGQNTILPVVYGKFNDKVQQEQSSGKIIWGGNGEAKEEFRCSFCSRHIDPYLRKIRKLLQEYPERVFEPEAMYLTEGKIKICYGWKCGDDLKAFVSKGAQLFKLDKDFRSHSIALRISSEDEFFIYVIHRNEDIAIFTYLRDRCFLEMKVLHDIENELKKEKPDWDFIMQGLRQMALIIDHLDSGFSARGTAFSDVKNYLRDKWYKVQQKQRPESLDKLSLHDVAEVQFIRNKFREVCDVAMTNLPPTAAFYYRYEKLNFDPPAKQDPAERETLIKDIRAYHEKEINSSSSSMLIQLLADSCRSAADLDAIEKELDLYLDTTGFWYGAEGVFHKILLKARVYDSKKAIIWAEKITDRLQNEEHLKKTFTKFTKDQKKRIMPSGEDYEKRIAAEVKKAQLHNRPLVEDIYTQVYLACWKTGDYDVAVRWLEFCGDHNGRYLLCKPEEHLKLVKESKDYFAFVRKDDESPLRQAIAKRDVAAIEAICNETKDSFLCAEAGLHLAELLLEQERAVDAKRILMQWKIPLANNSRLALAFDDLIRSMLSRRDLLKTKDAIALQDANWLRMQAFDRYSRAEAGEARRLGMKYLHDKSPELYEYCKERLMKQQQMLSYIILDFEDGLQEKTSPSKTEQSN